MMPQPQGAVGGLQNHRTERGIQTDHVADLIGVRVAVSDHLLQLRQDLRGYGHLLEVRVEAVAVRIVVGPVVRVPRRRDAAVVQALAAVVLAAVVGVRIQRIGLRAGARLVGGLSGVAAAGGSVGGVAGGRDVRVAVRRAEVLLEAVGEAVAVGVAVAGRRGAVAVDVVTDVQSSSVSTSSGTPSASVSTIGTPGASG